MYLLQNTSAVFILLFDPTKTGTVLTKGQDYTADFFCAFVRQNDPDGIACPFLVGTIPGASEIKTFHKVLYTPAFDTTPPGGRAATDGPCGRTSRESHPSEDLSELPPLRVAVAGQEYHYQIADGVIAKQLASAALWTDGYRSAPCLAVFDNDKGIRCNPSSLQVVLAHPPMSLQAPSREPPVSGRIPLPDIQFSKEQ